MRTATIHWESSSAMELSDCEQGSIAFFIQSLSQCLCSRLVSERLKISAVLKKLQKNSQLHKSDFKIVMLGVSDGTKLF